MILFIWVLFLIKEKKKAPDTFNSKKSVQFLLAFFSNGNILLLYSELFRQNDT